jgi:hypothetical protein
MKVAEVILVQDRQAPGRGHISVEERPVIELGPLDDSHPGQPGNLRPVTALGRRQDHGHRLGVAGRQLLDHSEGEGVVAADDKMIAAGRQGLVRGHGVILLHLCVDSGAYWPFLPLPGSWHSCRQGDARRPS